MQWMIANEPNLVCKKGHVIFTKKMKDRHLFLFPTQLCDFLSWFERKECRFVTWIFFFFFGSTSGEELMWYFSVSLLETFAKENAEILYLSNPWETWSDGWWGESAAHPLCPVETSDSSALLFHTDSQTEHITSDTGVEFTPKLTQYCFGFFFPSINLYFFYSSCWPIIHLRGRRGPSKSHLFSWEGRRRFQLKFTICAWPSSSTFIF